MTSILGITAPIFILIALGFTSVRSGLLSREHIRGMGVFVIKIALPALVVNALMHKQLHEIWQPQYLFAYGIASLLACAIGLYVYYRRFGEPCNTQPSCPWAHPCPTPDSSAMACSP